MSISGLFTLVSLGGSLFVRWSGVDESVVEKFAKEAGREPWTPFINTNTGARETTNHTHGKQIRPERGESAMGHEQRLYQQGYGGDHYGHVGADEDCRDASTCRMGGGTHHGYGNGHGRNEKYRGSNHTQEWFESGFAAMFPLQFPYPNEQKGHRRCKPDERPLQGKYTLRNMHCGRFAWECQH